LTAASFTPAAISGAVKINVFTHKILSNNAIETSASLVAKTTISGAGLVSANALTTEEATISVAGAISGAAGIQGQSLTIANSSIISSAKALGNVTTVSGASSIAGAKLTINGTDVATQAGALVAPTTVSGAGAVSGKSLTTEEASISVAGVFTGSGGISGQSLTVANLYKVTSAGAVSSSVGATLGNLILNDDATSLVLSGSMTGSGLATFTNTSLAQGGGYKPALIVSSSAISTAANAAAIPRMVMQGTDHLGNLADFMISVSGGILRAEKLTDGTWPV